jgi:hypothetical protein
MPIGPNGEPLPYPEEMMGMAAPAGAAPMPMGGGAPAGQPAASDMTGEIRQIREAILAFADANGMTAQERLTVEKITTLLQQLASDREKEEQGMLAGKMSPGAMQRAYAGG